MNLCITQYEKAGMYEHAILVRKQQLPILEHEQDYEELKEVGISHANHTRTKQTKHTLRTHTLLSTH